MDRDEFKTLVESERHPGHAVVWAPGPVDKAPVTRARRYGWAWGTSKRSHTRAETKNMRDQKQLLHHALVKCVNDRLRRPGWVTYIHMEGLDEVKGTTDYRSLSALFMDFSPRTVRYAARTGAMPSWNARRRRVPKA